MIKHTGIPALIAIDQEGGMVTRIYKDATYLPGNMAIGATNNPENAYKIGEIAGKELFYSIENMKRRYGMFKNSKRCWIGVGNCSGWHVLFV
jgi:hypothetical protein